MSLCRKRSDSLSISRRQIATLILTTDLTTKLRRGLKPSRSAKRTTKWDWLSVGETDSFPRGSDTTTRRFRWNGICWPSAKLVNTKMTVPLWEERKKNDNVWKKRLSRFFSFGNGPWFPEVNMANASSAFAAVCLSTPQGVLDERFLEQNMHVLVHEPQRYGHNTECYPPFPTNFRPLFTPHHAQRVFCPTRIRTPGCSSVRPETTTIMNRYLRFLTSEERLPLCGSPVSRSPSVSCRCVQESHSLSLANQEENNRNWFSRFRWVVRPYFFQKGVFFFKVYQHWFSWLSWTWCSSTSSRRSWGACR